MNRQEDCGDMNISRQTLLTPPPQLSLTAFHPWENSYTGQRQQQLFAASTASSLGISTSPQPLNFSLTSITSIASMHSKPSSSTDLKCPYCPRVLASRPSYDYHVRTHTGEKKYRCDFCPYRCILKCHLVNHLKIHTGEKPFVCPYCGHRCAQKSHISYHIMKHHPGMPDITAQRKLSNPLESSLTHSSSDTNSN